MGGGKGRDEGSMIHWGPYIKTQDTQAVVGAGNASVNKTQFLYSESSSGRDNTWIVDD